jgi:hypothetical protein
MTGVNRTGCPWFVRVEKFSGAPLRKWLEFRPAGGHDVRLHTHLYIHRAFDPYGRFADHRGLRQPRLLIDRISAMAIVMAALRSEW